jgi:hypothetical protein
VNRRSLIFGILCCLVGLAVGGYVAYTAIGEGYETFPLHAGAAALVTSALLWWLIMERPQRHSVVSGVLVGAFSGLLAHHVCWYFQLIEFNVGYWIFHNAAKYASSLGEQPIDLLTGILAAWMFTFWSWLFYGWMTVPAGGLIGGLYAWVLYHRRDTRISC